MCFLPVFHETYLSLLSLLIWHCLATQGSLAWTAGQGTRVHTQHGWMPFGVRKNQIVGARRNRNCTLPELARMELVAELLEREAAMLIALERMEAGMLVCPARD